MPKHRLSANLLLWLVYVALLAVLLPHTAWAFMRFEPPTTQGRITAWAASFAFEAAIAVLTHKLARHIESVPRRLTGPRRFLRRYLNAYAAGLVVALGVSALANLAHAVEFGQSILIFARWQFPFALYALAFGAVLPLTSLLFARVLSNVAETEAEENPELLQLRSDLAELRRLLKDSERQRTSAEDQRRAAEERFTAAGDLLVGLFAAEKRQRILAVSRQWPQLPSAAIAIIANASASYVSEILTSENA